MTSVADGRGAAPADRRGRPSAHATGDGVRHDLSQRLSDLARETQHRTDATAVTELIVSAVAGTIPGAEEASISLVQGRRRVMSAAAAGERARRFDDLQQEVGQGPCPDAVYEQVTVRVDDLATDPRWPSWRAGRRRSSAWPACSAASGSCTRATSGR